MEPNRLQQNRCCLLKLVWSLEQGSSSVPGPVPGEWDDAQVPLVVFLQIARPRKQGHVSSGEWCVHTQEEQHHLLGKEKNQ